MNKKVKFVVSAVLLLALSVIMAACGSKTESGVYTGTLAEALENKIVINTDTGLKEFKTDDSTVYDLGNYEHMSLDDVVDVNYHSSLGKMHADKVILREHVQKELVFSGTVSGVTDSSVTVTGKSLTVSFVRNPNTTVKGNLSVGDEADVIYTGDLSEYPFATNITVTAEAKPAEDEAKEEEKSEQKEDKKEEQKEEKKEAKAATVSGIVSEFTEKTVVVAIDSAKSYRFTVDKNTKITGVAKYLRIGDSVTVTFTGTLGKSPLASIINIVKEAQAEKRTVNGTIQNVTKSYVTLNSGKKVYMIQTDKNTKYTGDKPAKGYKSEITYTGNLSSGKAVATNIYCVKQTPAPKIYTVKFTDGNGKTLKTVKVEAGKAAAAPENPTREGYTFNGWDKSFAKVTADMTVNAKWIKKAEPAPEPQPEPEPAEDKVLTQDVTITLWTIDMDEGNTFTVRGEDDKEFVLLIEDDLDIAPGYLPATGDKVRVTYFEKSLKLIRIELLEKAVTEPEDQTKPEDQTTPEEQTQPEDQTTPEEQTQPEDQTTPEEQTQPEEKEEPAPESEQQEEAAPEPEPEPEPEPAPAPEPVPEPEVIISGEGVIDAGNESKGTFTIRIDGKSVELKIDGSSEISAGYFPEKGDTVKVAYVKNSMLLKSIQLISRPEPEPEPAPEPASDQADETAAVPKQDDTVC